MARTGNNGYYLHDTAAGDGAGGTQHYHVVKVLWDGFTDGSHTLQVKNGNGSIVLPALVCGAAASSIGPIELEVDWDLVGVETDVLGSGSVTYILQ